MDNLIGKTLGNYQIVEELGRGGMAVVYKAYQPSLNRYVALKVLPPHFTFDTTFVQRFLHEARTAGGLNHPSIITIHDVGEADGTYYIAMRFVEGGTLQQLIKREGALSPVRSAHIVQQLASALDYAHRKSLVHRDVKPSNIMLGDEDDVTLADFGIARAAEGTRLTQTGLVVGTPEYMSPEQARGEEVDYRTDIYSLGVVTYEMLAGRVPFAGTTPHAVLHKHVYETPPPLRAMARGIPRAVEKAISRALAKNPKRRYQSAGEMAEALSRAIGLRRRVPTPVPKVPTPVPGARRRAEQATVGAAAVRDAAAGAATVGAEKLAPRPKVPTPLPLDKRKAPFLYVSLALVVGLVGLVFLGTVLTRGGGTPTPTLTFTASHTQAVVAAVTRSPAGAHTSAPTRTPTSTPVRTSTPRRASPTPTYTIKPSPTVAPTLTPGLAGAPVLESPAQGAGLEGSTVTFRWHWHRPLQADEYFDVRVWQEGQARHGIAWTKESWHEAGGLGGGKYYWSVAVIRYTGTKPDGTKKWEAVSEESEVRWVNYSPPAPSQPTKTKPLPTPEPTESPLPYPWPTPTR